MHHCFVLLQLLCMMCPGVTGISVCQCFSIGTVGMHTMHSITFHESRPVQGVQRTEASEKKEGVCPKPVSKQDSQKVLLFDIRSTKGRAKLDTSDTTTAIASSSASSSSSSSSSLPPLQLGWRVVRAEKKYGPGASVTKYEEWIACMYEIYKYATAVYNAVSSDRRNRKASVMGVLFHV